MRAASIFFSSLVPTVIAVKGGGGGNAAQPLYVPVLQGKDRRQKYYAKHTTLNAAWVLGVAKYVGGPLL